MPRRLILHAGFHKTGTSTVQQVLRTNRATLKKHLALRLKPQMKDLLHATRGYSTWRDPVSLAKAQARFSDLLTGLPGMPRRTLVISAEELVGHMPGRGQLTTYSAAPDLLYGFVTSVQSIFPEAEVALYFSTRDPQDWLVSAYWEHVKSSNLTLDFDAFADRYAAAADLDAIVDEVTARVPCASHRCRIETCADTPLGPADPLLDLCDIPPGLRADLLPHPPVNAREDVDVLVALLAANRAYADRDARKAAKMAILARARRR